MGTGMALWWIGNAILIFLIIPIVVVLLARLARSASDVGRIVNTIHGQAGGIVRAVDDVKQLVPVRDRVNRVAGGLTRYVNAVSRVL
ncbi:MAG: hypothetical protein M3319_09735 [Actinomycetota bacterium]|nr:hypothetical protein [Actinomycetota bacterium]